MHDWVSLPILSLWYSLMLTVTTVTWHQPLGSFYSPVTLNSLTTARSTTALIKSVEPLVPGPVSCNFHTQSEFIRALPNLRYSEKNVSTMLIDFWVDWVPISESSNGHERRRNLRLRVVLSTGRFSNVMAGEQCLHSQHWRHFRPVIEPATMSWTGQRTTNEATEAGPC